jgi:hypothetical protein
LTVVLKSFFKESATGILDRKLHEQPGANHIDNSSRRRGLRHASVRTPPEGSKYLRKSIRKGDYSVNHDVCTFYFSVSGEFSERLLISSQMGAYHTLDLEVNRKFTLWKQNWDSIAMERVETACDPTQHADLAAIIMQDGIAFICLVTSSMTLVRSKVRMTNASIIRYVSSKDCSCEDRKTVS